MSQAVALGVATVAAATPLILAANGELVAEKSGVLNLGLEGMMLLGAIAAFATAAAGHSHGVAALAGMAAGIASAVAFAVPTLLFAANQYAVGLALTILGAGVSGFVGRSYGGTPVRAMERMPVPMLADIPGIGPILFNHSPMVYAALLALPATSWVLWRTKWGLLVRIAGESPESTHAIGHNVLAIRGICVSFGGAMAGLGGAYLAIAYTPIWVDNLTAGRGWIALALVVFSAWRPPRILVGAILFGGATVSQLAAQGLGIQVPGELLSSLPYLATIVALVLISANRVKHASAVPRALGKPYLRGD